MILVDWQIEENIYLGRIKVEPYDKSLINPASLDVRLSSSFSRLRSITPVIDPLDKFTYEYENFTDNEVILEPGECILGSTLEVISLPNNISYRLIGKSSMARLFVDNSSFGAFAESDFSGSLVMEFVNHSPFKIKLTAGMKIGQLVFYTHDACEFPYSKRASSKYMHQKPAQGSLYHLNG